MSRQPYIDQEIMCRMLFWLQFDISRCWCDLENKIKVTTILSTLSPHPNNVFLQVWSKSTHWSRRQNAEKADFYSPYRIVTLKKVKVTKIYNFCDTIIQYINLGQNPSFHSRDSMGEFYFGQN